MDRRDISPSHTLSGCRRGSGTLTGKENRDRGHSDKEKQLDRRRQTREQLVWADCHAAL